MSKTMIMLLNEIVGNVKEVVLGKSQIKSLEDELKYSYAKEDYEKMQDQYLKALNTAAHHENLSKYYRNEYDNILNNLS